MFNGGHPDIMGHRSTDGRLLLRESAERLDERAGGAADPGVDAVGREGSAHLEQRADGGDVEDADDRG